MATEFKQIQFGHRAPNFGDSFVHFANLSLELPGINKLINPITTAFCSKIESTYKSPAHLNFLSINPKENQIISENMQFDDICLEFLSTISHDKFYIIISSQFARTLLVRLLATTLIEDQSTELFSETEKGIFSFIVARMIFDLRNTLPKTMPGLKLLGIYHHKNPEIKKTNLDKYGCFSFNLSFAAEHFSLLVFVPKTVALPISPKQLNIKKLLLICGHIKKNLVINLIILRMKINTLANITMGDAIFFNKPQLDFKLKTFSGPCKIGWYKFICDANLGITDNNYFITLSNKPIFFSQETSPMEEVTVNGAYSEETIRDRKINNLENIAQNIEVPVSIQIARKSMTLHQIAQLQPESIIPLGRSLDDPLDIVVENKIIGHCIPVQINGRLGIKILELNYKPKN